MKKQPYVSVNFRGHADDILTLRVTGAQMDRINRWMRKQGKAEVPHRYKRGNGFWVYIKMRRIDHMFYNIANR